jgi:eukaryotic-like serine/threonine-protein kinase
VQTTALVRRWRQILGWPRFALSRSTVAREVTLPEISRLADHRKFGDAYAVGVKAEKSIADDLTLAKMWPVISYQLSLETTPPGVDVSRRDYVDANAPWEMVGRTPLKNVRQPRGMFVWKFEKPGFGTVLRTTTSLVPRLLPPRRVSRGEYHS